MSTEDEDRAIAREQLCRCLAACYYEPGPSLAEDDGFQGMIDAAARLRDDLAEHARTLGESFSAEGHERLLADYGRLFLGPPQMLAPPYGSVWLDGARCVIGVSTLGVIALYRDGDFDLDDSFDEPPDHIAAELEFLHQLISRTNEAQRTGDAYALKDASTLRRRLLDSHLMRWVAPFAAAMKASAQSTFYRELAEITERFVRMEAAEAA